jgi:hypothetical protein
MMTIIVILIAAFLYFLPTIIAWNKKHVDGVIAINLFLGWTLVGWVVALAWACTNETANTVIVKTVSKPVAAEEDRFDKLKKLKQLLDTGAITQEEYKEEKHKILNTLQTEWRINRPA